MQLLIIPKGGLLSSILFFIKIRTICQYKIKSQNRSIKNTEVYDTWPIMRGTKTVMESCVKIVLNGTLAVVPTLLDRAL